MRGKAGGPVRGTRTVAVQGQVLLCRRATPRNKVSGIVSALSNLPTMLPGAGGGVVFDGYGGMINQTAASETAFVHRNAVACAQYSITYPAAHPIRTRPRRRRRGSTTCTTLFSPVTQGSYQNYIDPTLTDWQQAYYGANLPRLRT